MIMKIKKIKPPYLLIVHAEVVVSVLSFMSLAWFDIFKAPKQVVLFLLFFFSMESFTLQHTLMVSQSCQVSSGNVLSCSKVSRRPFQNREI